VQTWTTQKLGAAAGIAFIILTIVSGAVMGSRPDHTASASKIASYFGSHHSKILVAALLAGLAAPLFLWLVVSLAGLLRAAGESTAAGVVVAVGAAGITLATVQNAIDSALTQMVHVSSPSLMKSVYHFDSYWGQQAFWFAAVLAFVTVVAARRKLPDWYIGLTGIASVLFGLGALAVKGKGFFGVDGGMGFIAFIALGIWVIATSVLVWQATPAPEPVTAPA
jgi:hypothetical protein